MRRLMLILLAASAAFGQNTLSITASRQINAPPDQVTVLVSVTTDASQTLDNVLAFVQPVKITAANFSSVQTIEGSQLLWLFTTTATVSNVPALASALTALQKSKSPAVDFSITQQSATSQQCPYAALISDAQTQANKLAAAAGVTLGPIVSLSQVTSQLPIVFSSISSYITGVLTGIPASTFFSVSTSTTPPPCTLSVQFQITP
jgi:hypothetical protein